MNRFGRPFSIIVTVLGLSRLTTADCECGYSLTTADNDFEVFTDLLESDFIHVNYVGSESRDKGWATQDYNKTAGAARGPLGESFVVTNAVSSEITNTDIWTGNGSNGGSPGLQLIVNSQLVDGMVQGAEVATTGIDYFYGTFRIGMMVTDVPGTCSAFFWYFNDTQEIDMEFLSAEFNHTNGSFPVNLVLHVSTSESSPTFHFSGVSYETTPTSQSASYDASETRTFIKQNLPFDPSGAFHEYRFDYLHDRVLFYADGALLASMNSTGDIPTSPGHLLVSHWSNGNPAWSRGPPEGRDAVTTVSYVKGYYNSSDLRRQSDYITRCGGMPRTAAVCEVPENDATFFFMYQDNTTRNNSTRRQDGAGKIRSQVSLVLVVILTLGFWICGV